MRRLYSFKIPLTEKKIRSKHFCWVHPLPKNIKLAILHQGNNKEAFINFLEVNVDPKVVFAMGRQQFPDGSSFVGASKHTVEEITNFNVEIFGRGVLFYCEILNGFAKQCFACPCSYLTHEHLFLKMSL